MPVKVHPLRAILGGFIGCVGMLVFMYAMPLFGAPRLNIFALFSTLSADYVWWAEPLEYLILGTLAFPLLYAVMLYDELPGHQPWQKGLAWGLILWILRGLIVAPVMGEGIFSLKDPHAVAALFDTLVAHLVYGLLLGLVAGQKTLHKTKKTPSRPQVARR